jgi:hypothetical protein
MRNQRAPAKGPGLPNNACADDLFTRIDELRPPADDHGTFPVRYFLGFVKNVPHPAFIHPDSWMGKVVLSFRTTDADKGAFRIAKILLLQSLVILVYGLGFFADFVATLKIGPGHAADPRLKDVRADIAAKELVGRITGVNVEHATQIDQVARNYLDPTETLTPGDAVSAYLADEIDEQAVDDYGRAGNRCTFATQVMVATQQVHPDQATLIELCYKGVIDRTRADQEFRRIGYLSSEYVEWQHELHKWWPDSGTLVTWMRHGITHEQPAKGLDLDRDFADAYGDEQKKWAASLGLSDDQVKWLWRSQYQPVDLGTAYDWYRRTQAGLMPAGQAFGDEDLVQAIAMSTLPPAYRNTAKVSVWQPLSARLLRTAYDEGLVGEQQVMQALVTEGYSPDDAAVLLSEWVKLKPAYVRKKIGAPGVPALLKLYANATISRHELLQELAAEGLTADEGQAALVEAQAQRARDHRAELVKSIKSRYVKGEVDEGRASAALSATGLDPADVHDLLSLWRVEFEVHPKQPSAGELVAWYKQGLIREDELVAALVQLRYSAEDVARMIAAADLGQIGSEMKRAETLMTTAGHRLKASEAEFARQLAAAEKIVGKVSQRTVTSAGKALHWIVQRVVKKPKTVSEKSPDPTVSYAPSEAALQAAQDFVDSGAGGVAPETTGVEAVPAEQPQAAGDQSAAAPPDAGQAGGP